MNKHVEISGLILSVLVLAPLLGGSSTALAQTAQAAPVAQLQSGAYFIERGNALDGTTDRPLDSNAEVIKGGGARVFDIGFRIDLNDIARTYFVRPKTKTTFAEAARRISIPTLRSSVRTLVQPLVTELESFITKMASASSEKLNGLSNLDLARKITRASFCFGTDPYAVTYQIGVESTFDRTRISPTKAVGLTQMTSVAIDEANDQLGNRGNDGARAENVEYWKKAISCYKGKDAFAPMFEAGIIPRGKLIEKNAAARGAAKTWIRASIDRQIIYGQIILKLHLARASGAGLTGLPAYQEAMRDYNGDRKNGHDVAYGRKIVRGLQTI